MAINNKATVMKTNYYSAEDATLNMSYSTTKNFRFSFTSFQNAIRANSALRKQIEDIVDLGLFDFALRRNTDLIQAVREKAEIETIELMMRFASGVDDYQRLKKSIHRNRVIRTLAIMDRNAQLELVKKINPCRV
jgi:hypothetical protein